MALSISKLWLTLRIEEDGATGSLHAEATDGNKTATSSVELGLPAKLVKDLQKVIKDNADAAGTPAMEALVESLRIDRNEAPPPGVIELKLAGGVSSQSGKVRVKRKGPADQEEGDR